MRLLQFEKDQHTLENDTRLKSCLFKSKYYSFVIKMLFKSKYSSSGVHIDEIIL